MHTQKVEMKQNCNYFFTFGSFFWSLLFYSITVSDFTQILPHFSRQNGRVILEVLLNLYFTARSLVWENEWNNWEMFTSSLRSYNLKSVNIFGKIGQCVTRFQEGPSTVVHSNCKRSSLRSQCWMRLFGQFSNTVRIYDDNWQLLNDWDFSWILCFSAKIIA